MRVTVYFKPWGGQFFKNVCGLETHMLKLNEGNYAYPLLKTDEPLDWFGTQSWTWKVVIAEMYWQKRMYIKILFDIVSPLNFS